MIQASYDQIHLFAQWIDEFGRSLNEPDRNPRAIAERFISEQRLFAWADGDQLCSMAAIAGPTPNGIRINFVYTPSELRGRRYASNLVAVLSQRMLDSGRKFCFLFTDLANPTSNKIYQRMGYEGVADFHHWSIVEASA